jgi:uncharacterized phage protein gp47/JayE
MADFGLTGDGFVIKRLEDIKKSLEERMASEFGEINVDADSPMGQTIGVMSEAISDVWANMGRVYQSFYPASAEGFSLDNAVQFNGITRNEATPSTVYILAIGDQNTLISIGKQVKENLNNEIFETVEEVKIGIENIVRLDVSVDDPVVIPHLYSVSIDSVSYSYTSQVGDTATNIIAQLVSNINNNQPVNAVKVTATDNSDGTMRILVDDKKTNVTIVLSSELTADEIGSSILTKSSNTGLITAPIGTIDTIVTPVTGWDSVENLISATIGRNLENDVELRARRKISLQKLGNASIPAMKAKLLDDVDGVTAVTINENDTEIDYSGSGGLKPHSIECVVSGGTDKDVAEKIWEIKAGGIQTEGNTSKTIVDSEGVSHTIKFTIPQDVYGYVQVAITKVTDGTETFPLDGVQAVIDAIAEFGETYQIGEDILIQRFFTPIFSVEGVKSAVVKVDMNTVWNPSYAPIYGTSDIPIDSDQVVKWNQDKAKQIIVTVV